MRIGTRVIFYNDPWSGPVFRVLETSGDLIRVECLCTCERREHTRRSHLEGWGFANWFRPYKSPAEPPKELLQALDQLIDEEIACAGKLTAG